MADLATQDNSAKPDEKQSGGQKPGDGSIKILSPFTIAGKQGIIFGISVDGGASQTSGWKIHSGSNVLVEGRGLEAFNQVSLGVEGAVYPGDNVEVNGSRLSFSVPQELDKLLADGVTVILLFGDKKNVLNTRPLKQKFIFVHQDKDQSEEGRKKQKSAEELSELGQQSQIISELINSSIGGTAAAFGKGFKSAPVQSKPSSVSTKQQPKPLKQRKKEEVDENIVDEDSTVQIDESDSVEMSSEMAGNIVSEYINNDVSLIVNPVLRREVTEKLSGKQTGELSVEAKTALKGIIKQGTSGGSNVSVEVQEALKSVGSKESTLNLGLTADTEDSVEINRPSSGGSSSVEVTQETGGSSASAQSEKENLDVKAKAERNQSGKVKQSLDASAPKQGADSKKVEGGDQQEGSDAPPSANIEGEEEDEASAGLESSKLGNQQPTGSVKSAGDAKPEQGAVNSQPETQAQQATPPPLPQSAPKPNPKTPPPLPRSAASNQQQEKSDATADEGLQTPPPLPNQYSVILNQFKKNDSAAAQKIYGQGQSPEEVLGAVGELPNLGVNTGPVNNTVKAAGKTGKQAGQNESSERSLSEQIAGNNLSKTPEQKVPIESGDEEEARDEQQEDAPEDGEGSSDQTEPKPGEQKKDQKNKEQKPDEQSDEAKDQAAADEEAAQDQAGSLDQQPENQIANELLKSQGLDEVVKIVNMEMNIYLNTAAGWIWAAAIPSIGLSLLLGAVVGDLLFLLKNWLVKRAIGVASVVSLSKAIKISDYSAEEIARKIKFSSATIVNVVLMNVAVLAVIFVVVVGVTTFLKVTCSPVKIVEGLPEISTIQSVCNFVNNIPVGGSTATPTPIPTPPINLR